MAKQVINIGAAYGDKTGDKLRDAGTKFNSMFDELYGPILQVEVAAGATLALIADHMGKTIILAGAGSTYSGNAATLGNGFVCKIINDSGSDLTVPTLTGGANRYDVSGHTKIMAGGSASIEIYTRSSTRYVHVSGTTSA